MISPTSFTACRLPSMPFIFFSPNHFIQPTWFLLPHNFSSDLLLLFQPITSAHPRPPPLLFQQSSHLFSGNHPTSSLSTTIPSLPPTTIPSVLPTTIPSLLPTTIPPLLPTTIPTLLHPESCRPVDVLIFFRHRFSPLGDECGDFGGLMTEVLWY